MRLRYMYDNEKVNKMWYNLEWNDNEGERDDQWMRVNDSGGCPLDPYKCIWINYLDNLPAKQTKPQCSLCSRPLSRETMEHSPLSRHN